MAPSAKPRWRVERDQYGAIDVPDGWMDDRDDCGCEVHWTWLRSRWHALADKLVEMEARGVLK